MSGTIYISGRGETYRVNDRDQITSANSPTPSDSWKVLGAVEYKTVFGRSVEIRHYTVADIRQGQVPWRFKNGTQRCFLIDLDHGHRRVWMSPTPYSTSYTST